MFKLLRSKQNNKNKQMLDSLGKSNHPPYQMQGLDYSVTNFPSSDIVNLEDTLVDKQLERKYKGYTPPNAICKGTKDADTWIDANPLTDGPLRYGSDIHIPNSKQT